MLTMDAEDVTSESFSDNKERNICKVKASITEISNTDEEIIRELAPEIEKFGMIKMTIKVATIGEGVQYRWVVVRFDDTHDYNDFKHYITLQKGQITIFGHTLDFKFMQESTKKKEDVDVIKRKFSDRETSVMDEQSYNKMQIDTGVMNENRSESDFDYKKLSPEKKDDRRRSIENTRKSHNDVGTYETNKLNFQRYDDKTPTRTLYFGNLDKNTDEGRLKRLFSKYGKVLNLILKRKGRFASYGFVKFLHLNDALEAKNQLAGTYVGRQRMAIGFGSICQTCLVWIGDYTRQIDAEEVAMQVKKFSDYLEYSLSTDKSYIYFVFKEVKDSIKADFADPYYEGTELYEKHHSRSKPVQRWGYSPINTYKRKYNSSNSQSPQLNRKRNNSMSPPRDSYKNYQSHNLQNQNYDKDRNIKHNEYEYSREKNYKVNTIIKSPISQKNTQNYSKFKSEISFDKDRNIEKDKIDISQAVNSINISNQSYDKENRVDHSSNSFPCVWKGSFVLKGTHYGVKLHLLCGNNNLINNLPKIGTELSNFASIEFTKRYPLDPEVIEEFKMNLASSMLSNEYCAMIGLPGQINNIRNMERFESGINMKYLKDMVAYLTNKNTAIRINDFDKNGETSLFVFPPCEFANEYLHTTLSSDNKMVLSLAASSYVLIFVMAK